MHNLLKRFKKLLSLPPKEIVFRLKSGYILQQERLMYTLNIRPKGKDDSPRQGVENQFFLDDVDREKRLRQMETLGYKRQIIADAEQVLTGTVNLLGIDMLIPEGDGWITDPQTGKQWPFLFYNQVRHHPLVTDLDIKFVWEINRHQYLIPLGQAFWITREEKYAGTAFAVILDWIQSNPYHTGVNWTSALENAVRLFSWIWVLELCRESTKYNEHLPQIRRSIHEQAHYINRHLSIYASPYNHLIGEAAALFMTGSLFPELPGASIWKKTGWKILEKTIDFQFHDDGMTVEQAVFYHHFTLGFYIICLLLRKINHEPIPETVMERIQAALEVSFYMQMPDGSFPMKGDIDSAKSIYTGLQHSWDFSFFHFIGACLFTRPDFLCGNLKLPREIFWLLSDNDLTWLQDINSPKRPPPTRIFKKSGYCIIKDSWEPDSNYLCFDFGAIAHGLSEKAIPSAAHGHLDALSVECCALGRPFLIDAGFFTYFGDLEWHQYFRHETAHNTVAVHGHPQADYCGRLKWQNVRNAELVHWQDGQEETICSGKISLQKNLMLQRTVHYRKKCFWIIHDSLASSKNKTAETFLNFHPDITIDINRQSLQVCTQNRHACMLIQFLGKGEMVDRSTNHHSPVGWVCRGYGLKKKACAISVKWTAAPPESALPFVIVPFYPDEARPAVQWDDLTGKGMIRTDRFSFRFIIHNRTDIHVEKVFHDKEENP